MSNGSKKRNKEGKSTKVFAGRYAYKKPLGRGAGGSVYLAEDLRRNYREVALKVLSAEACETVQGKMLRREFEILSKLDHPNLVRVYDYGTLPDGGVFLAEEYIDGFSLQDARALLEPAALIDPTLQILQGLAYLHGMGMIHRDIKPANVMLLWLDDASARPMIKLVDFGLSSMNPKRDTLRGGTRSYMAPEIIRGDKAEPRSDLYSLGVTLYYALCGVLPFGPRSKKDPPPTEEDFRPPEPHRLNEEVPLELSRFTMALLRQVSDVDYADAGEALQALADDAGALEERSVGQMANSLDVSAAPVIRGYFERGILSRRVEEDDLLLEWLSMAEEPSSGQMYLVRGDEGVGKSRLLHDVQASAKLSGHLALSHSGGSADGPYALLLEMVKQLIEVARSHDVVAIEKYEPALCVQQIATRLGDDSDELDTSWMKEAIETAVSMLTGRKVVYFIDDIDRADEESRRVLRQWFEEVSEEHRPAIVATSGRSEFYMRCSRQDGVQVLPIDGVGKGDVEAFLGDQLGIKGFSRSWLESVAEASKGRPAYIEELCRYLIDAGMLWRESVSRWSARVDDVEASGVPATLRESLRRRVTAVGASGRECLELLALMERSLSWKSARRLLERGGSSSEEAEQTLQTVQWRHLITMELTPNRRYVRVVHRELADAVADMISPEWRRALHRRIGEQVVRDWQRGSGDAVEAAAHLQKGGSSDEASAFFEIAGDSAVRDGRQEQASHYFEEALEGAQTVEGRALLHDKLACAELARFQAESSREHFSEALHLAETSGKDWLRYRVGIDASYGAYARGDVAGARSGVDALGDTLPDMVDEVELVVLRGILQANAGSLDAATALIETCIEKAKAPLIPQRMVEVLSSKARFAALHGDAGEALSAYRRARKLAQRTGDPVMEGTVLLYYGTDLRRMDSPVEAREALTKALSRLAGARAPHHFVEVLFQLAWTLVDLGSSSLAKQRALQARYFARRLGHRPFQQKIDVLLGSLVLTRREVEEGAIDGLEQAIEAFDRGDDFAVQRAEILMELGDLMITLQMKQQGPALLQRGRQAAYEIGASGLLPPVEE